MLSHVTFLKRFLRHQIPSKRVYVFVCVCENEPMRENKKEWHSWLANIKPTTNRDCDIAATAAAAV